MDIIQWLLQSLQIKESVLTSVTSLNLNLNSILFLAYVILSLMIKRAAFLAAFFASCLLFDIALFDVLSEASLYALTFAIYSYAMFCKSLTLQTKGGCVIIMGLAIILGYDAYFYGIGGYHGATETFVYNNIESLALSAHCILIATLIPYRRIRDNLRRFFDSIVSSTPSAYNVLYIIQTFKSKA